MDIVIRSASTADAAPACALVRRSIIELCGADHQGDKATISEWLADKKYDTFASWIGSDRHIAIVAEIQAAIAGFAVLNRSGTIALLYVAPEFRFRGASKAMLTALERDALALGIAELVLESSITALAFYERRGYSQVGAPTAGFGITHVHLLRKRMAP